MADWKNIGNYAEPALLAASLTVWLRILVKWIKGNPPLALAEQPPPSWDALSVGAAFLMALFLPSFLVELLERVNGPIEHVSLVAVQFGLACSIAQIVMIVGLLRIAGPLRKTDFGCDLSDWRRDLLIGAAGFLASILPVSLVTELQRMLNWRELDDKHDYFKILDDSSGNGAVFLIVAAVVIVGPLTEELLYRVLLQGWIQSHIAPAKAIGFSAAIFCLVHRASDRLPLVPLALILGYIYYRRRSYVAVVAAHGLFNAIFIALALLKS
jgi:membrane protease YdiL (CAAX protease family)